MSCGTPCAPICLKEPLRSAEQNQSVTAGAVLLVCLEGFAIGTLAFRGISFMRADLNLIEDAVVGSLRVMLALHYGTGDTVVGALVFHGVHTTLREYKFETDPISNISLPSPKKFMQKSSTFLRLGIDLLKNPWYNN